MQHFTADMFTATRFDSAEDKAKFANWLADFILSGFKPTKWHKTKHRKLSNTFGHIAHCNSVGFYDEWFRTPDRQREYIAYLDRYQPLGHPEYTFVDVEREIKSWMSYPEVRDKINAMLERNLLDITEEEQVEKNRIGALLGQTHQEFVVAGKSSNTGDFGHRQYVVVARDGSAWRIQIIPCNLSLDFGQVIKVPLKNGLPTWVGFYVECPERAPNAPAVVVEQVWEDAA